MSISSKQMAKLAYEALSEKKASDIKAIDISGISVLADYFVIADGANQHQIEAMCDAVEEALLKADVPLKQVEGNRNSSWMLLDFGDIIVHVFSKEDRLFYDLERIWGDGKFMDVSELEDD